MLLCAADNSTIKKLYTIQASDVTVGPTVIVRRRRNVMSAC